MLKNAALKDVYDFITEKLCSFTSGTTIKEGTYDYNNTEKEFIAIKSNIYSKYDKNQTYPLCYIYMIVKVVSDDGISGIIKISPVPIESFETDILKFINTKSDIPSIQKFSVIFDYDDELSVRKKALKIAMYIGTTLNSITSMADLAIEDSKYIEDIDNMEFEDIPIYKINIIMERFCINLSGILSSNIYQKNNEYYSLRLGLSINDTESGDKLIKLPIELYNIKTGDVKISEVATQEIRIPKYIIEINSNNLIEKDKLNDTMNDFIFKYIDNINDPFSYGESNMDIMLESISYNSIYNRSNEELLEILTKVLPYMAANLTPDMGYLYYYNNIDRIKNIDDQLSTIILDNLYDIGILNKDNYIFISLVPKDGNEYYSDIIFSGMGIKSTTSTYHIRRNVGSFISTLNLYMNIEYADLVVNKRYECLSDSVPDKYVDLLCISMSLSLYDYECLPFIMFKLDTTYQTDCFLSTTISDPGSIYIKYKFKEDKDYMFDEYIFSESDYDEENGWNKDAIRKAIIELLTRFEYWYIEQTGFNITNS